MNKRILTAVLGIPFIIGFVMVGGLAFGAFVVVLEIIMLSEYFNMLDWAEEKNSIKRLVYMTSVVWAVIYTVILDFSTSLDSMMPMVLLLFTAFALLALFYAPRIDFSEFAVAFCGTIYIVGFLNYLLLIRRLPEGLSAFIALLIIIWTCDTIAYFVGIKFGKRRLAPLISPKKSWEGAMGGYLASGIAFLVYAYYCLSISIVSSIMIALIVPLVAQVGDLIESYIKRHFAVKDSGSFLPGHGGLFDRFDSMLFAAPFYFYLLTKTIG